ncbi:fatty acid desaturase [Sphingomonas sp. CARO-RG-8B-R24-01]|uniref:fatty acid desaturase n=1 Tax=Sphingomonas sp. CARO-RG-8B-R24-01 TaxID=2914831 RepID=UPI001F58F5F8|nr:fatty acid desaturase [Sphingomonas sp. CARO-RG-8B-R24-01]
MAIEWPTLLVAVTLYAAWLAATWWHAVIPDAALAAIGAWLIAWHGSLQHETIHGHPTRVAAINGAIGFPPLALWLPYSLYRRSHVAHHRSVSITDPDHDPESRYVTRHSGLAAVAARMQAPLLGRLVFGPPIAIARLILEEAQRARKTPLAVARDWLPHAAGVAILVAWLSWTGVGMGRYCLLFVYPGMALTLLRSFVEHRADLRAPGRAATVERGGVLGLLYLNNNLHAAHHDRPELAWYRLPAYHARHRARLAPDDGAIYRGYGAVFRRFAVRRHDALLYPGDRSPHP